MKKPTVSLFRRHRPLALAAAALAFFFCLNAGCGTWKSIATRDTVTISRTTKLRTDVQNLMAKAQEPYSKYSKRVDKAMTEARNIHAHQKTRPNNELSVRQWDLLLVDSAQIGSKAILPEFFITWKRDGTLKPVYIEAKRKNVDRAFDEILKLENAKPLATN